MEERKLVIEQTQPFELTLEAYRNMIYFIINKYCHTEAGDYKVCLEDLFQEGSIGLYEACLYYSSDKDAKFSTFAYKVIKRRIEHKLRVYMRPIIKESYSTDLIREIDYYDKYVAEDNYDKKFIEERLDTVSRFIKTLSKEECEIIKLRQDNLTYKDISLKLKLNQKHIDNQLQSIRRKYRKFVAKENINLYH